MGRARLVRLSFEPDEARRLEVLLADAVDRLPESGFVADELRVSYLAMLAQVRLARRDRVAS